jgi:hypothetical protein
MHRILPSGRSSTGVRTVGLAVLLSFALVGIPLGSARATTVVDRGIEGLVAVSERVVVARVSDVRVRAVGRGPDLVVSTETHLQIEHARVGPASPETVVLAQPGGSVWIAGVPHHHRVPGAARFEPGERVLVFLERTAAGGLVVAGLALGKYTLDAGTDGPGLARRTVTAERVGPPSGPTVGASPAALRLVRPAADDELGFGELVARIRRAAGRRASTPSGWVR